MSASALACRLSDLAYRRIAPDKQQWLESAAKTMDGSLDRRVFAEHFARASRMLGRSPLELSASENAALKNLGIDWPLLTWRLDDLGRAVLLLLAVERCREGEWAAVIGDCYHHGDSREREAVLKTLPLLPEPGRFLPLAAEACRSHIQSIFEALTCENPYPAAHMPDLNFNQMALKSAFIGLALKRIVGLDKRRTPELARMAEDYIHERKAAGRSVPVDIGCLTGVKS